jgi:hypothetical protein
MRVVMLLTCLFVAAPVAAEPITILPAGQIGIHWPIAVDTTSPPADVVRGNGTGAPRHLAQATAPDGWHLRSDADRDRGTPCPKGFVVAWLWAAEQWFPGNACVRATLIPKTHPPR